MNTEPPKREDGACTQCGKSLIAGPPKSMPKVLRPMFIEALAAEPFCSAPCARAFHGVPGPAEYAIGSGIRIEFDTTPTALQEERRLRDQQVRQELGGKNVMGLTCDWCNASLPNDYIGIRRFCSTEHRRAWHGTYKKGEVLA